MLSAKEVAALAAKALDAKMGEDIRLIGITDISTLADYFLICTATSSTHVKTLCDYAEDLGAPGRDDQYGNGFPVLTQCFHDRLCPGRRFADMPDADAWSHAGLDYWHYLDITYYDGLADFFARNNGPYYYFTTKAPQRYTDVQYPDGAYLVFGREDAGLPEALLVENQEHCIRMPMRDTCRSLNLSNSVAVGVYEVTQKKDTLILNLETLDLAMIRGLLQAFNGRVTAGAGTKPYLSVVLQPDEKPLELLQNILKAMDAILNNKEPNQ